MDIQEFRHSGEIVICTPEEYIELFDECKKAGMYPSNYASETRCEAENNPEDYPYFLWADSPDVLFAGKGNDNFHRTSRLFSEAFHDHKPHYEIDQALFGQLIGEMQ